MNACYPISGVENYYIYMYFNLLYTYISYIFYPLSLTHTISNYI